MVVLFFLKVGCSTRGFGSSYQPFFCFLYSLPHPSHTFIYKKKLDSEDYLSQQLHYSNKFSNKKKKKKKKTQKNSGAQPRVSLIQPNFQKEIQWRLHKLWQHNRGNCTTPTIYQKKTTKKGQISFQVPVNAINTFPLSPLCPCG